MNGASTRVDDFQRCTNYEAIVSELEATRSELHFLERASRDSIAETKLLIYPITLLTIKMAHLQWDNQR